MNPEHQNETVLGLKEAVTPDGNDPSIVKAALRLPLPARLTVIEYVALPDTPAVSVFD